MAGPWEQFQQPAVTPAEPVKKPWEQFSAASAVAPVEPAKNFSYVDEVKRHGGGAIDTIKEGYHQSHAGGPWERFMAVPKMAGGALSLAMSPLTSAQSLAGRGIEKATGGLITEENFDTAMLGLGARGGVKGAPVPFAAPPKLSGPATQAVRNAAGTIEKIASPETVDPMAKQAVAAIREAGSIAARDTASTEAALEPAWKKVSAMPVQDRLDFLSYVENRSNKFAGLSMKDPALQDLADKLRTAFDQRMAKIQALPSKAQADFIEDYFPHFWKDPAKATDAYRGGGFARQGSGASLKKRTVPTIADGIAMGLEPVTTDPIAATLRYVQSMDRFIASIDVLDTAKAAGTVRYIRPRVMGASGHPDSFKVPEGWAPLKGRGSTDATGAQAYAPEGWARIYNNWASRGIAELGEEYGNAYEATRRVSNGITALELGLSGYHALTMMQESMVNSVANAVGFVRKGKPIEAGKSLAKATVAPISYAVKGNKLQNVYLGLSQGSKEMEKIVDLLTKAGGRARGARHAPDYDFSKTGAYTTALKRGQLRLQLAADAAEVKGSPVRGTAQVAARHLGRIMDTVAQPLFEAYIPRVKNGAFYENMSAWLKSHQGASEAEQANAARQIWDSVDNRFGELVQDNIFINKTLKQVAMLSLRSWSWTMGGDIRELGGAVRDTARAPFKKPTGTGPQDVRWTQKMDYALALPIVYGTLSAIYQAMKTGQPPESMQDVLAPRTGGTDPATGQPERLMMPGYMKDVFGFYENPVQEATNKIASGPRMAKELITNQNWRGDPIFPPKDMENSPSWLKAFWDYALENVGPISLRNLAKGTRTGSNLNPVEQTLGVRSAPRYLTDPEGFEQMMNSINQRKWKGKERHDRAQQRLYE